MSAQGRLATARLRRRKIAALTKRLREGDVTISDVLRSPPEYLKHVRIYELMLHTPKLGEAGVRKCLRQSGIEPIEYLGILDQVERMTIIANLPPRAR